MSRLSVSGRTAVLERPSLDVGLVFPAHGTAPRHRARAVSAQDFTAFDLILALDSSHMHVLERAAPKEGGGQLRLFMDFTAAPGADVPDPYYGDDGDFEQMLDLIEDGVGGILGAIKSGEIAPQRR